MDKASFIASIKSKYSQLSSEVAVDNGQFEVMDSGRINLLARSSVNGLAVCFHDDRDGNGIGADILTPEASGIKWMFFGERQAVEAVSAFASIRASLN